MFYGLPNASLLTHIDHSQCVHILSSMLPVTSSPHLAHSPDLETQNVRVFARRPTHSTLRTQILIPPVCYMIFNTSIALLALCSC